MADIYTTTIKLEGQEKMRFLKLKNYFEAKILPEKMTVVKSMVYIINHAHDTIFGNSKPSKSKPKKQAKKGVSSPTKGDDMANKINELFVKSDTYTSSQNILQGLGLPSSEGRKLAVVMNKLKISGKKTKTGKVYFCKLKT